MFEKQLLKIAGLSMVLFGVSCSTGQETKSRETFGAGEGLVFGTVTNKVFEKKDAGCDDEKCAEVRLSYPDFSENKRLSTAVSTLIGKQINYYTRTVKSIDFQVIANAIFNDYHDFIDAFPEAETPWSIYLSYQPMLITQNHICLEVKEESYTGGAHPVEMKYYVHLDEDGKQLELTDWIIDMEGLANLGATYFRKQKNIPADSSLSDYGFMFENDTYALPENIGLTPTHLILIYNPYEIESYAEGAIELVIPAEKIKGFVSL